ncbi:MAG: hypothetical protein HUK03_01415 [Bacteroidaceae bacterium]|nr:hypothetical protein [Bacteroidaceae bacterium]
MKKTIVFAGLALAALCTLTSCDQKKKAATDADVETEVLVDSIKQEAIAIFDEIEIQRVHLMQDVIVTPEKVIVLEPKFFLNLSLGEVAETADTKADLLGMYAADQAFNEQCYGSEIKTAERAAVIRKLGADLNLAMPTDEQLDSISQSSKADAQKAASGITGENFRKSLESDNAATVVRALTYFIVETTLDNEEVYNQLNGFVDEIDMAKRVQPATPIMINCVKLIKLLAPYYPNLESMTELTEKVEKVMNVEEDSDEYYAAVVEYFNYIKSMRGKIVPVEARD